MTVRKPFALARILAIALVLGTFALPARALDPYEINVVLEQTGSLSFLGFKQVQALGVLETLINATGGVQGRPLKFVIYDDQSSPQVAVQLVAQLSARKVPAIVGPGLSAVCSAVIPLVEKSGPVTWCFSPVVRPAPGGYAFMGAPGMTDVQPVIVRYFYERGARNFALINSTDATGQYFDSIIDTTLSRLEFRGAKLVAREHFNPTDLSVAAQMARIKAAHPDVLLTYTSGTPFGTVLHGISDIGLDVPVYSSGANMEIANIEQYRGFLPKELIFNAAQGVVPDPSEPAVVRHRQSEYFAAMKKAGLRVEASHSLTWDPVLCLVDAFRHLGPNATADQVHDYLEHLRSWVGVAGVYNFATGDQRGLGENGVTLFRWNAAHNDLDLVATGPKFR